MCGVLAVVAAAGYFISLNLEQPIIRSDGSAYYGYLRLYLIHHQVDFEQMPGVELLKGSLYRHPKTGRVANQFPIGTALAELPFFLVGHAIAAGTGAAQDGLSPPYQWAIFAGGLCWLFAGLSATWAVTAKRLSQAAALAATAVILFGTNLLHYAISEPSMSHVYAFAMVGIMLWLGDRFWGAPTAGGALALGLASGFLVCIRSYDVFLLPVALFPAFQRPRIARQHGAAFLGGALAGILPQLIVAAYYLGAPWATTYYGQFFWHQPQLLNVLLSVKKGWWFWTPVSAVGFVGLAVGIRTQLRWFCALSVLAIGATFYLVSAWVDWAMGASFGQRAFVDCLPVLAVGIALLLQYRWAKLVLPLLVAYNLFLTWAYWNGEINAFGMHSTAYVRLLQLPLRLVSFTLAQDSRSPVGLAADMSIRGTRFHGQFLEITSSVHNTGSARWLADLGKGQVYMAVRAFNDPRCEGSAVWEFREPVPMDLAPGGSITLSARIPRHMMSSPFRYVCAEMMGVVWFRDAGPSRPAVVAVDYSGFGTFERPEFR